MLGPGSPAVCCSRPVHGTRLCSKVPRQPRPAAGQTDLREVQEVAGMCGSRAATLRRQLAPGDQLAGFTGTRGCWEASIHAFVH